MAVVSKEELFALKGKDVGTSEWMLVDQDRVNKFAEATGDFQFIHVDPERAKLTPFGGPIAHGFLSLSLLPVLTAQADLPRLDGVKMGVKMLDIEEKRPGQFQQTMEFTLEIEGEDKPALMAEWITQFFI